MASTDWSTALLVLQTETESFRHVICDGITRLWKWSRSPTCSDSWMYFYAKEKKFHNSYRGSGPGHVTLLIFKPKPCVRSTKAKFSSSSISYCTNKQVLFWLSVIGLFCFLHWGMFCFWSFEAKSLPHSWGHAPLSFIYKSSRSFFKNSVCPFYNSSKASSSVQPHKILLYHQVTAGNSSQVCWNK